MGNLDVGARCPLISERSTVPVVCESQGCVPSLLSYRTQSGRKKPGNLGVPTGSALPVREGSLLSHCPDHTQLPSGHRKNPAALRGPDPGRRQAPSW